MKLKPRKTVFITKKQANFWFLSFLKLTQLLLFFRVVALLLRNRLLVGLNLNPRNLKPRLVVKAALEVKNYRVLQLVAKVRKLALRNPSKQPI
nr:MAG TPA: hypothetical protein [Caudoviricetes sp.]